jgi:alpha-methylacyl-CoA racemase
MPMAARQAGVWDGTRGTGLLGGGAPFYDVFETADGLFLTVGALEAKFWDAFVARIGVELPDRNDLRNWPEIRRILTERIVEQTQAEWVEVFDGSDACVAPVVPFAEAADHPHLAARAAIVDAHGFTQPAPAPRFSGTPAALSSPPTVPGAHTRETLLAWGIDDADDLLAAGIATQA